MQELAETVLGVLRPEDLEVLLNLNFRRPYGRNDVIHAAGETVDRFHLVEQGILRLDSPDGGEPRFLRPGQVIGSTSLFQARPSEHNVVAHEDLIVITLSRHEMDWLADAEPGVAARLFQALVLALAARNVHVPVGAGAEPAPVTPREEPSGIAALAEACEQARKALEELGPVPEEAPAFWARERIPAVAAAYRPVLRQLAAFLNSAPPGERDNLVPLARRELLRLVGSSRLVERMNIRTDGRTVGYRGFNHIYRNVPEGDDPIGLLTDAWLLTRPFAEAIRERRTDAAERLTREVLDRARPDRIVRILSLGAGPARSLADLLEEDGIAEKISITCVDDDQEALVHANNLLKSRAPRGDIKFRQASPSELTPDEEGLGGYDIIASLYTPDTTDATALGRILFTAHRWLHAYGVMTLVVFGDAVPDWLLLEVLFDWKPRGYSVRELQDIVSRSPFKQTGAEVDATPSGLNVFLRAVK